MDSGVIGTWWTNSNNTGWLIPTALSPLPQLSATTGYFVI